MSFTMPPEWAPHRRTWMAWPCNPMVIEAVGGAEPAYRAWAEVANAIVAFEQVAMVCRSGDAAAARSYLDPGVELLETALGDSWMRDIGPSFVVDEAGRLGAVGWTFNGWGGRTFPDASADAGIGRFVAEQAGAQFLPSKLVNEGGAIHVDGEGTVLLTESVLLNPNRNPNWTKAEVEAELHAKLGTRKAIWLPRGGVDDSGPLGTDGHVDGVAGFVKPGVVVAHGQPDPQHPDYEIARENAAILRAERDAQGRALEVVVLDAVEVPFPDGESYSSCYINFLFVNGGVVQCGFDDPQDETIADIFRRLIPDRRVVSVNAKAIWMGGGGVHCITQQEPLCKSNGG